VVFKKKGKAKAALPLKKDKCYLYKGFPDYPKKTFVDDLQMIQVINKDKMHQD